MYLESWILFNFEAKFNLKFCYNFFFFLNLSVKNKFIFFNAYNSILKLSGRLNQYYFKFLEIKNDKNENRK